MKDWAPKYRTSLPYMLMASTCIIMAPTTSPMTGMMKGFTVSGSKLSSLTGTLALLSPCVTTTGTTADSGAATPAPCVIAVNAFVVFWIPFDTAWLAPAMAASTALLAASLASGARVLTSGKIVGARLDTTATSGGGVARMVGIGGSVHGANVGTPTSSVGIGVAIPPVGPGPAGTGGAGG